MVFRPFRAHRRVAPRDVAWSRTVFLLASSLLAGCSLVAGLRDWREGSLAPDGSIASDGAASSSSSSSSSGGDGAVQDGAVPLDGADEDDAGMGNCDLQKPFGPGIAIAEINSVDTDAFPRLSPDERTIYFESTRLDAGSAKIFRATRASRSQPFTQAAPIPELDLNNYSEHAPSVSADGLSIYWYVRDANGPKGIFMSTRQTTAMPFASPVATAFAASARDPYLVPTGIYLASGPDVGPFALSYLRQNPFANLVVTFTNGPANGFTAPVVSADGLVFYGSANGRIWRAQRAADEGVFDAPTEVIELNDVAAVQAPGFVSRDGCRIYFHRSGAVSGGVDIFMAERPPK